MASRADPCTCGGAAHRVGVLHAAAVLVRLVDRRCPRRSRQRLPADAAGRGAAGRRGCAPRTGETTRAARPPTSRPRCRRRARAARRPHGQAATAVVGCVPLMSASPSFGCERDRPQARARERGSARSAPGRRRRSTSPSPTSTSARCASGARSPLAPTDPRDGTSGCTPALRSASSRSSVSRPDAREPLREDVGAQRHRRTHRAHRQRLADAGRVTAK